MSYDKYEHVGITGSRHGMTDDQKCALAAKLEEMRDRDEVHTFHHGDCTGADVEGAEIAYALGFRIIAHPPDNPKFRAYHDSDEIREPKHYYDRNRDIVNETGALFACPNAPESEGGGTWWTVRYAREVGARYELISPQPLLLEERNGWDDYIWPGNHPADPS